MLGTSLPQNHVPRYLSTLLEMDKSKNKSVISDRDLFKSFEKYHNSDNLFGILNPALFDISSSFHIKFKSGAQPWI